MPMLPLPCALPDAAAFAVALRERDALLRAGAESGPPFDALERLIEDYEARCAGYDLARMRAALSIWNCSQ